MKSVLGLILAVAVVFAFALTWRLATRESATFLDQQWLFLVALPFNWGIVQLFGESGFTADAPSQVLMAAGVEAALAYLFGAVVEAAARGGWRTLRRTMSRA